MANQKKGSNNTSAKIIFWIVGLVAVIIMGFIFLAPHKSQNTAGPKVEAYKGKSSASVSIIEFGDYKCPYCKMFNEKVVPTIKQKVDKGEVKLYFISYSFIYPDSTRAAKFPESVYAVLGSETFWKFHDLLYQKQPEDSKYEKKDIYDKKFLTEILKEIVSDEDVNKVVQYFTAKKADAAWQKDMDLVNKLNVNGTPTIFVNGKLAKTMDDLLNMVDQAANEK